jgi:sulfur carrier protein ThiS
MKVRVKLIAVVLSGRAAAEANSEIVVDLPDGTTPNEALAVLGLPATESYLTLVNEAPVPPAARGDCRLMEGDSLVIFPPLEGG